MWFLLPTFASVINAFVRFWLFALPRLLISRFSFLEPPFRWDNARGFSFPRNIPTKNFSENFFITTQATFCWFFGAKNCGGERLPAPCNRGGYPFFVGLWACLGSFSFRSLPLPLLSVFPCCSSCAGSFFCPLLSCRWVVLVGGAWLPSFPCPFLSSSILVGLLGCGLPCIRLDSAALGAPESIGAAGLLGALRTGAKGLKKGWKGAKIKIYLMWLSVSSGFCDTQRGRKLINFWIWGLQGGQIGLRSLRLLGLIGELVGAFLGLPLW